MNRDRIRCRTARRISDPSAVGYQAQSALCRWCAVALKLAQYIGTMNVYCFMAQLAGIGGSPSSAFSFHQQFKHTSRSRVSASSTFWHRLAAAQRFYRIGTQIMPAHADGAHGLHQFLGPQRLVR